MPNTTQGRFIRLDRPTKQDPLAYEDRLVDPISKRAYLVGTASFANGTSFVITREPGKGVKMGGFKIVDAQGNKSYAGSLDKAWASVRYMAQISQQSERSSALRPA